MESQSWIFGSAADCDVRVTDDPYVSPHHCEVTLREDGSVSVRDLGSTNGTFIIPPGIPPTRIWGGFEIAPGWTIRIGRTDIPWRRP